MGSKITLPISKVIMMIRRVRDGREFWKAAKHYALELVVVLWLGYQ